MTRAYTLIAAASFLVTVSTAAGQGVPPGSRSAPPADSIDYVHLEANRGLLDCQASQPADRVCRARRGWSANELRARLDAGTSVFREGDELTFAYRGEAQRVELGGGIQGPLSPVLNSDLWVLTVRVPRLDEAMLSYFFVPITDGAMPRQRFIPRDWRGPRAPAVQPRAATEMRGRIYRDSIDSRFLGAWRAITVYVPHTDSTRPIAGVVFMGDGAAAETLGELIDPLIEAGRVPPVLLVGIHADTVHGPGAEDGRGAEYLTGGQDGDPRFHAHERFVIEEVLPWAQAEYGVPREASRRAMFGFSNSAALAVQLGLRHPDQFGRVLAFSPAGARAAVDSTVTGDRAAAFYLVGGLLEPAFHAKAVGWAAAFRAHGIRHVLQEPVAGHDWAMWESYFPDALVWAFGGGAAR